MKRFEAYLIRLEMGYRNLVREKTEKNEEFLREKHEQSLLLVEEIHRQYKVFENERDLTIKEIERLEEEVRRNING